MPLPHNGYCPSHQHLAETEESRLADAAQPRVAGRRVGATCSQPPSRRRGFAWYRGVLLGVDVGGTFTDAVLLGDGVLVTAKAPTTPEDQSLGVMAAVEAALARAGRDAGDGRRRSPTA